MKKKKPILYGHIETENDGEKEWEYFVTYESKEVAINNAEG